MNEQSRKIGHGDAVSDSLVNAASYASSGDFANAILACYAAAQAAQNIEATLAQQPQMGAITNALSNMGNAVIVANACNDAAQLGTPCGLTDSDYQSALAWAQAAQAAVQADSLLNSQNPPTPGPSGSWTSDPTVVSTLGALTQVSDFTSTAACGPVMAFQAAVKAAGGPALTIDGGYGTNTAGAAAQVSAANGLGNVPAGLSSGWPTCGAPPPPPPSPDPVQKSGKWGWWIVGLLAAAGLIGLGWWAFYTPGGREVLGLNAAEPDDEEVEEKPRRRRRRARRRK